MRSKGNGNIREYIMEMSNLTDRIKRERTESAHLATNFHGKKKRKSTDVVEGTSQQNKKQAMENPCFFYKKKGHLKKDCPKYLVGRFWCYYSHKYIYAGLFVEQSLNDAERFNYVGDDKAIAVEVIGPFAKYLEECGIVPQYMAKRQNRTLKDMKSSIRHLHVWGCPAEVMPYRLLLESGNARFLKDVEFEGEDNIKKVVFEEELVSFPNMGIDDVQTQIPDFIMEPIQ
ncbi:Retrovirus-related Pol polyprotein from transposon TNT 1-94 [Cucumis melo var. makuwa]|uniref:Retrovirus-related Pol polyprotein from transposon TNT 1-94 n=1 Tax=Cucumis melo var. makuwa TaxID=1194695 RepID=A0A5D3E1F5_CUCMM|nr:Retrovirus-related Pol polyprotein from transposon TNT 1-94 [Cucumis melo var. makuwa]